MSACDDCLRRAQLLAILGPRIAQLTRRPSGALPLLTLPDEQLARAVAGDGADAMLAALERLRPSDLRTRVDQAGLSSTCMHAPGYPALLEALVDAPRALFVRGDLALLRDCDEVAGVAIVGARKASPYGLETAFELGRSLAVAGVPVISGMALGIDAAAHRGALAGGGRALAVLASGADVPYPRRHHELYRRIAETGAVVSEMPPGTPAAKWAFPARNRIMAGLARMTVVVEAAQDSGTLITAAFALELHRDLGAVPGRVNSRVATGANNLIADGAVVVRGVHDVLDTLFGAGARTVPAASVELEPSVARVLDAVEAGEPPPAAELGVRQVRAALGRLEALGLVRRDALGGYERTGMRCERA